MSICESAGEKGWALGRGPDGGQMAECLWVKPVFVEQFEFVEWTDVHHLRHSKFVGLRYYKNAKDVRKEA